MNDVSHRRTCLFFFQTNTHSNDTEMSDIIPTKVNALSKVTDSNNTTISGVIKTKMKILYVSHFTNAVNVKLNIIYVVKIVQICILTYFAQFNTVKDACYRLYNSIFLYSNVRRKLVQTKMNAF